MVYAGKNISNNFVCVFPANRKSRLTDLSNQMRAKIAQYLYMITNNYAEDKHGTQWWSFLDTKKKNTLFLFNSFGTIGLLGFLVEKDKKIFKKVITSMQQIFKRDNEVTLLKWSIKRHNYQCLIQKELQQLLDTAFFFFRFFEKF